jgi:SGNH domain (fused to AT3 domains)
VTRLSFTTRTLGVALVALTSLLTPSTDASTKPAQVVPGSPAQVAALVAQSGRIAKLPPAAVPQLTAGGTDTAFRLYPTARGCSGSLVGCEFGDLSSSKIVVLFGDSHILMWLPAIVPAAIKAHIKIDLMYADDCPVALIGNFTIVPGSYGTLVGCEQWRNAATKVIHDLNPSAVIIGERTTLVFSEPQDIPYTPSQWQLALETTIVRLRTPTMKIAVMQDTNWFDVNPMQCLAANPNHVQACDEPFPNIKNPNHDHAEWHAAIATGTAYVFTRRWLCTAMCSPVIGSYITNYDNGHLSATYAAYLSIVVGKALAPFFS